MPATLLERPTPECPKHMEYGPCGGVELDGTCEVAPHPCVFLDLPTVRWQGVDRAAETPPVAPSPATAFRDLLDQRPIVVVDFPAEPVTTTRPSVKPSSTAGRKPGARRFTTSPGTAEPPPGLRTRAANRAALPRRTAGA